MTDRQKAYWKSFWLNAKELIKVLGALSIITFLFISGSIYNDLKSKAHSTVEQRVESEEWLKHRISVADKVEIDNHMENKKIHVTKEWKESIDTTLTEMRKDMGWNATQTVKANEKVDQTIEKVDKIDKKLNKIIEYLNIQ